MTQKLARKQLSEVRERMQDLRMVRELDTWEAQLVRSSPREASPGMRKSRSAVQLRESDSGTLGFGQQLQRSSKPRWPATRVSQRCPSDSRLQFTRPRSSCME